jgi:Ca2+-binding RTX toxin-like protein
VPSAIVGTASGEILSGTAGGDTISGLGGNDTISGGAGNDTIYAGSLAVPNTTGTNTIKGDGGNDTLIGGKGRNSLDGSNATLRGVNEQDRLVGNTLAVKNTFILGNASGCYYLGGGNNDYATIVNFDPRYDKIELNGTASDYLLSFTANVNSLYRIVGANQDLIAKINTSSVLTFGGGFTFLGGGTI